MQRACDVYRYDQQTKPLLSCNVKVKDLVLLNSEPIQDPTRAHQSPSDVAVSKPEQLTGPVCILTQTNDLVLSWNNLRLRPKTELHPFTHPRILGEAEVSTQLVHTWRPERR